MVKKKKANSNKNKKFNPLYVGLFVALVLALVFIGIYSYTSIVSNPSRLKGELASLSGSESLQSKEYTLDQTLGLGFAGGNEYLNWGGRNEKWLTGAGGGWYYITPDGNLYQWLGGSLANDPLIDQVSSAAYADTSLLYNAVANNAQAVANVVENNVDELITLDQTLGLGFAGGNEYLNWGGRNEKWLTGAGGGWYYITPDGNLYQWLGGSLANDPLVEQVSTAAYTNTALLYNAQDTATYTAAGFLDNAQDEELDEDIINELIAFLPNDDYSSPSMPTVSAQVKENSFSTTCALAPTGLSASSGAGDGGDGRKWVPLADPSGPICGTFWYAPLPKYYYLDTTTEEITNVPINGNKKEILATLCISKPRQTGRNPLNDNAGESRYEWQPGGTLIPNIMALIEKDDKGVFSFVTDGFIADLIHVRSPYPYASPGTEAITIKHFIKILRLSETDYDQLSDDEIVVLDRVIEGSLWHERVHGQIGERMVYQYIDYVTGLFNHPPLPWPEVKGTPQELQSAFVTLLDNEVLRIHRCENQKQEFFETIEDEETRKDYRARKSIEIIKDEGVTYYCTVPSEELKARILQRLETEFVCQ